MSQFALSPDGRLIAGGAADDDSPLVWEAETGRVVPVLKGEPGVRKAAVGFAGKSHVWVRNRDANTFVPVEVATGKAGAAVQGFPGTVFVAVSPDGRKIAASGWKALVLRDLDSNRGWEILDDDPRRVIWMNCTMVPPQFGTPVRFSPCGRWLLVDDKGLEVWNVRKQPRRHVKFDPGGDRKWTWRDGTFSPDGRLFAAVVKAKDGASELAVWELATATEVYRFRPVRGVAGGAFTPDGKRLIVAHSDTTLSVWDRASVEAKLLGAVPRGEEWQRLLGRDAKPAHAAMHALAGAPRRALAVLKAGFVLPPAAVLQRLITELGDEDFATREAAQRELAKLGLGAEPALRAAATRSDKPEVRARAGELLRVLGAGDGRLSGERLRAARAVEVLERIATLESRKLLEQWAVEHAHSVLGAEARATLDRLAKSSGGGN